MFSGFGTPEKDQSLIKEQVNDLALAKSEEMHKNNQVELINNK